MTDITNLNGPKNTGPKPRLSLLSSKQSTRLKSNDNPLENPNLEINFQETLYGTERIIDQHHNDTTNRIQNAPQTGSSNGLELQANAQVDTNEFGSRISSSSIGGSQNPDLDKMSVSKEDLIRLLSLMKSELKSKEIALASIKLEQLKRLLNPVEINRSTLAATYTNLQDRLKAKHQNVKTSESNSTPSASNGTEDIVVKNQTSSSTIHTKDKDLEQKFYPIKNEDDDSDGESLTMLNTLLELLDKHPLLALSRDSIYCLDYNCNELSTKNYLNLKIQHLENLIDQHRRYRCFIEERLKRSEQRYMDLTFKLELERNLNIEKERSAYRNEGKALLLNHIDQIKEALEKERASKHAIVMTLLNDLLDERELNETLKHRVVDLEKRFMETKVTKQNQVQKQQSSPTSGQQGVCKPRVPAKPAQLLDRQRSQTNNR